MVCTRPQIQASRGANEAAPLPQTSLGTAPDIVELNWILFDKFHRTPAVIVIPRDLYEGRSQHCQPLFMEELRLRYGLVTTAERIEFWTPKEPLSIEVAAAAEWAASIDNLKDHFTSVLLPFHLSRTLTPDDDNLLQLVVTIRDAGSVVRQSDVDAVPELKEFKRYGKTMRPPSTTPSTGAKAIEYRKIQGDDAQAIYDGRRAPSGLISTTTPPIQIFHPIFDDFIHLVNNPDVQPTAEDLKDVQELMYFLSEVGWIEDRRSRHNEGIRKHLRRILRAEIHEEANADGTKSDGVITLQIGDARIALLILELKRELGEGGCDPTTKAGLSMKHSWIDELRMAIREKCCCPTFLVAGGGPWLSVLGGVFTDRFIVQRLTDMRWMALSSTEEDNRVYHNARVLVALRECLVKLNTFYRGLQDVPPFADNKPHPRYFPYPTSFTVNGSLTCFRYLESLEEDPACVTYLAEIPNETDTTGSPVKVVVKFVARYGEEVHKFLAGHGYAPTLRHCGPLSETKLSGIFPGPAQSAGLGLCLRSDLMHMVVMEYIPRPKKLPVGHEQSRAVREQIKAVLILLHSEGYVFGDLRKQNIVFDADGKVKLIDFNWCGRYNMDICDANLSNDVRDQIDKHMNRVKVGNGPYAYYPLSMSTLKGMWAPGMEPLAQIRPQHDWMMLDKLSWD